MQKAVLSVMVFIFVLKSKFSNAGRIVKTFILGAELQLSVHNYVRTVRISKLIVAPLQRFVSDRKVTLQTFCTYNQYILTLFM